MTTKPKAKKFRIRRDSPMGAEASQPQAEQVRPATSGQVDSAATVAGETDIDAIRREGLTGRQLRMARRVAQKTWDRRHVRF